MTSDARGKVTIDTENGPVALLFTNRAIANAEKTLGKSILQVTRGFTEGQSGVTEVGALLHEGMEAARREARTGRPVTINDAYALLDELGFAAVSEKVMIGVADVLTAGQSSAIDDQIDPNA